jgi:hypothetical protein
MHAELICASQLAVFLPEHCIFEINAKLEQNHHQHTYIKTSHRTCADVLWLKHCPIQRVCSPRIGG